MRLALVEESPPLAGPLANPVRTEGGERPRRVVTITYTDFAQVRCRHHTLYGAADEEVAAKLLQDLGLRPEQVRIKDQQLGDVVVIRRMPDDVVVELDPTAIRPVAFVDGLTEYELGGGLAAVAARLALNT